MNKEREYGIDLLRIILMFMIVLGHLYTHTGIRMTLPEYSIKWNITWIIQTITICSVDCFVIISGYFGVFARHNSYKVVKLWGKVIFYSIVMTVVALMLGCSGMNFLTVIDACFPVLREQYWFITSYILLYILSPYLNKVVLALNMAQAKILGIVLITVFYVLPIFSVIFVQIDTKEGFGIIGFVTLYLIGAILRKIDLSLSKKQSGLIILANSCIMFSSKIILTFITELLGKNVGTGLLYHYNTIFVLCSAISMVYIFKGISFNSRVKRIISAASGSVFGVYLIHEKPIIRQIIWNSTFTDYLTNCSVLSYVMYTLGFSLIVLVVGILADYVLSKFVFSKINCSYISKWIQKKCQAYNDIINEAPDKL